MQNNSVIALTKSKRPFPVKYSILPHTKNVWNSNIPDT
nr:MAG TPA: hypothetical protein [Caudoviricetes sp.]